MPLLTKIILGVLHVLATVVVHDLDAPSRTAPQLFSGRFSAFRLEGLEVMWIADSFVNGSMAQKA
jgi:hypothetical protein